MSPKSFPAIEGLRALFGFWIVALHQHMIQKCLLALYKRMDLLQILSTTVWSGIAIGHGYQVDFFFALSAFLFTWGIMNTQSNTRNSVIDAVKSLFLFVVKRVLRLWPVLIAVLAIAVAVNDYGARDMVSLLKTMAIPTYFDEIPQAAVPAWSNRVDIEACVVIFVLIKIFQWCGCLNTFTALLAVPVSLVPKALRFLSDPDKYSYMRLGADLLTTAIMIPQVRQEYYRDFLFKGQMPWFESMDTVYRMTPLFFGEYIVQHQRWSPAFAGFAMAVALYSAHRSHEKNKERPQSNGIIASTLRVLYRIFSLFLLLVSILLAGMPVLMSLSPATEEVRTTMLANPPLEADFVISVLGRTLNSIGWCYLLYRCLLPKGHVLRLNYFAAFLEQPVFQWLGRHSYCVYMLHYMVLHFVSLSLLSPTKMEAIVGIQTGETLLTEFALRLAATYSITLCAAVIIVRYIEEPALRVVQSQTKKLESILFGYKKEDNKGHKTA